MSVKSSLFIFLFALTSCMYLHKTRDIPIEPNRSAALKINGCYIRRMDGFDPDMFMVLFLFPNGAFFEPPMVTEDQIDSIKVYFDNKFTHDYLSSWGSYSIKENTIYFTGWSDDPWANTYTAEARIINDTSFVETIARYGGKKWKLEGTYFFRKINYLLNEKHPKLKPKID